MNIEKKVVVITGASRGIGKETALELAKKGCSLGLLARDESKLLDVKQQVEKIGGKAQSIVCDVSNEKSCYDSIQKVQEVFGRIDVLVNNAGYGHYASVEELDTESLENIIKTNLFGSFWCAKAVIPFMKEQKLGHIVNVSTVISKRAFPYMSAYCMSKFAMTAFDESLRLELKPFSIGVSLVCPGYTKTDFHTSARSSGKKPKIKNRPAMSAKKVAKSIVSAIEKNKARVTLTFEGKVLLFLQKISPSLVDFFLLRLFPRRDV